MTAPIAILRRPDGLFELAVAATGDVVLAPVARNTELMAAWQSLAAVMAITPSVLEAVRTVIVGSRIDPEADAPDLEPLRIALPPAPHRPTAARPRAYKGTKDRPPKSPRPPAQDLRPQLCSFAAQDRLVALLAAELEVDAGFAIREYRDAPTGFRRLFGWQLRARPAAARRLLSWHHALQLDRARELAVLLAQLCARCGGELTAQWCEQIAAMSTELRTESTRWLLTSAVRRATATTLRLLAAGLLAAAGHEDARRWLLWCVEQGHDLDDATAGLAFVGKATWFRHEPPATRRDAELLFGVSAVSGTFAFSLWLACRERPGLAALAAEFADLSAPAACEIVEMLSIGLGEASEWATQRRALPAALAAVAAVEPRWQQKAARIVAKVVSTHGARSLAAGLRHAAAVISIVCVQPCEVGIAPADAIERVIGEATSGCEAFARLPADCWRTLDAACRRKNDSRRIGRGLVLLGRDVPGFARAAWIEHGKALLRAARTLGSLSFPLAEAVLGEVVDGPLWCAYPELDARELASRLRTAGSRRGVQPITRRLRRHLDGELELTAAQLARDTALLRAAWSAVVADAITERCVARLARTVLGDRAELALDDDAVRHAVLLYGEAWDSRRGLRRLLQACIEGNRLHVVEHPENVAWRRRQPKLDFDAWRRGVVLERALDDGRTIRIAVESDPLQALQLGTHVGSCFGVGGAYGESAIAVVLDANKQVAFARDRDGGFVARQIIAITDDGRLACFSVYPLGSAPAIRRAFADWDRALAAALDLQLAVWSPDHDPEIAMLVAGSWWNDDVWTKDLRREGKVQRRPQR